MNPDVIARIPLFVTTLQNLYNEYFAQHYSNLTPDRIDAQPGGSKYLRITATTRSERNGVITDGSQSVYCFIDLKNGDIYKAAGWKGPAKGARGNIFNDNCDVGTRATVHGGGLYIGR